MIKTLLRTLLVVMLALHVFGSGTDDRSFFAARRKVMMKKIEDSIAVLEGAADTYAYLPFRQSNDFYYLTGVEVPGAYVIVDAVEHRSILLLPARNRMQELWEGSRLQPGDKARALTGFDEVLEVSHLQSELAKRKGSRRSIYSPMKPEETAAVSRDRAFQFNLAQEASIWDGRSSRPKAFVENLKKTLGDSASVMDLSPILDEMRRVKDPQEVARLRESARIGALGMIEAIRAAAPGLYEYQIASVAEFLFMWHGAMGSAYFPIVGSGPNSCILHYHENRRQTEAGDLVVMDFGPDFQYYASDITRTFPVSEKFTSEQAKVYQIVLEAQKAAIERIRPGATMAEVGEAARDVFRKGGYTKYLKHGISHYVGMSTHDVGEIVPLEPGVVLTVEPGLYITEKNLGVRIEDTVLVTREGREVLSKDVPKEIPEIERLRSEKSGIAPKQ